jgi:predicted Fe-S protein YdhL (DUF1289 family)
VSFPKDDADWNKLTPKQQEEIVDNKKKQSAVDREATKKTREKKLNNQEFAATRKKIHAKSDAA